MSQSRVSSSLVSLPGKTARPDGCFPSPDPSVAASVAAKIGSRLPNIMESYRISPEVPSVVPTCGGGRCERRERRALADCFCPNTVIKENSSGPKLSLPDTGLETHNSATCHAMTHRPVHACVRVVTAYGRSGDLIVRSTLYTAPPLPTTTHSGLSPVIGARSRA